MDCLDAQFYLRLRRHSRDELGADAAAALADHLAGCPGCDAAARAMAAEDAALARAMADVPVPAGFRGRLTARVTAARGRAAYRRWTLRLTAAAAVLVAFMVGAGASFLFRPALSTDHLLAPVDAQFENPEARTRAWLAGLGLPDWLPEPFDLTLSPEWDVVKVQGKDVPVLRLAGRDGRGFAKVYFVRESQFKTGDLPDLTPSSNACVRVVRGGRGVVYVILHTGTDLRPFLRTDGRGAEA